MNMKYSKQIVLFVFLFIIYCENVNIFNFTSVIQTDKGPVRGKVSYTVQHKRKYWAFLGIPHVYIHYKVQPPEEVEKWNEVINAIKNPKPCPQRNPERIKINGVEDCLKLTVLTPMITINNTQLRAVMVYIFGGAFSFGNITTWGHDFFLEEDVVMVAMNYRLGALGFLCLNHPKATGNTGIKDQQLALKWIQRNIQKFGGDPKKVTIFGQSTGAVLTQLHILSDNSKGLFRGAIVMSGSPLSRWAFSPNDEAVARAMKLGEIIGVNSRNKDEILQKLYDMSAAELINGTEYIPNDEPTNIVFKPTIEYTNFSHAVLTIDFDTQFRNNKFSNVPIILGFVSDEFLRNDMKSIRCFINFILKSTESSLVRSAPVLKFLKKLYDSRVVDINEISVDIHYDLMQAISDIIFVSGIDKTQRYLSAFSSSKVYYYRNSFDYGRSLHKLAGIKLNGTAHSDDTAHIFWIKRMGQSLDFRSRISIHRRKMVRMWANFAKYLDPTPGDTTDAVLGVKWIPSNKDGSTLDISNSNLTIIRRPISNLIELLIVFDH